HIPELVEQFFPLIAQIMQRFMNAENMLHPLPIPMLMRTFMGMILGYFMTKNVLGESIPPEFREDALEHFIEVYLYGILKSEKTS
ncbi:MAG: hypothetical protein HC806_09685, partial [Anaerolineae bacterium]|nr:hypothetical protein [Anaerolineae bacterium]